MNTALLHAMDVFLCAAVLLQDVFKASYARGVSDAGTKLLVFSRYGMDC